MRYKVPDKYLALYASAPDEPNDRIRYFAVISALDVALDELNLPGNTLVIFLNDNGANTSREHGLRFVTNAPFRGGRPDCWEGGIRVPAIFRWPGRLPSDIDCHQPLIATDVLPLILSAAGVALPKERVLDGFDPTSALRGDSPAPERMLFWEYQSQAAVRHGRY